MKKTLSIIILILLCLQLSVPRAVSADGLETGEDETINLINTFYVSTTKEDHVMNVPFNPTWFNQDARIYNHDLAKLSLGLATAAFRPSASLSEFRSADYNLGRFLAQAGFEDARSDDYNKDPSMYTVSTMMAHRKIGTGDDTYELIAVGICGQGYLDEWESNFSIGSGKHPEGFDSASQLVYDRVFGYISATHLSGKLKIWVSGFSRAAAISNITAARLSDSDLFSQETVFAYTFATPMTVREEEPKLYENIFNICGKMDPVTNVPFSDWGYSRYGMTLYTPTIETDSDFILKREKADVIYKEITGIDYWVNADINSELKVIMDCLLRICPDVETYENSLQDNLISLWEKHDVVSVLKKLMEMSEDPILITEKNRADANMLMNRLSMLFEDYLSLNNSFSHYNREATMGSNILQTHTPELYISWIYSVDEGEDLFTDTRDYSQLYIDGNVTVELYHEDELVDKLATLDWYFSNEHQYLSIHDVQITVLIPRDGGCRILIFPEEDQKLDVLLADFKVGHQSPSMTVLTRYQVKQGEKVEIAYNPSYGVRYITDPESTEAVRYNSGNYVSSSVLADFVYKNNVYLSWRDSIMTFYVILLVMVCFVFFLVSLLVKWLRHRHRRKKGLIPKNMRFRPLPIFCFFLIQQTLMIKELAGILYDLSPGVTKLFKILIGILLLLIAFYGYRRKRNSFHLLILVSVLFLSVGDLLVTDSLILGGIFFIAAEALLTINFIREDRPDLLQILGWLLSAIAGIVLVLRAPGDFGAERYLTIVYVIFSTGLVASSYVYPGRIFRGSLLLFAAGVLAILNAVIELPLLVRIGATLSYYIAVITLASAGSGFVQPRMIPEAMLYSEGTTQEQSQ